MHRSIESRADWLGLGAALLLAMPAQPPPAVFLERTASDAPVERRAPAAEGEAYDIGNPTDEEQMYLELINRARLDPLGEGPRMAALTDGSILGAYEFFDVDIPRMIQEIAAYPVVPPLAFEPRLISAARGHSAWMFALGEQSHEQFDPVSGTILNTISQRVGATGYPWQQVGESIFAYAENPLHGHAGFEVDWGDGPGGVQDPPGHRNNNHNPVFREVGVGVINGFGPNNTGPQFVTINFASRPNSVPLVTGVVYYDVNGNEFYDPGEGIGGVTVEVSGATSHAITSASGGYAVPTSNGARSVQFTSAGLDTEPVPVTVVNQQNVKVDLRLPYVAPVVTGPAVAGLNVPNSYSFTPVAGAVGYRWRAASVAPPAPWNADYGLERVLVFAPGTPVPLVPRGSGQAYHLTHGVGLSDELLVLQASLRPRAQASVQFVQKLGWASDRQVARFEVSPDEGRTWEVLWELAGSDGAGAASYTPVTVDLAAYAGRLIQARFGYRFQGGTYFNQTEEGVGFHVDDIVFVNTDELVPMGTSDVFTGTSFAFRPAVLQDYELSVQPFTVRGPLPFGLGLRVGTDTVVVVPVEVSITGVELAVDGKVAVNFTQTGTATEPPRLLRSTTVDGVFAPVPATLQTNAPGSYRWVVDTDGAAGFLRVEVP